MKIAVLAGGLSPERDVSLTSGSLIAAALCEKGHRVCLVDIYLGVMGNMLPEERFTTTPPPRHTVGNDIPDLEKLRRESGNGDALIGQGVIDICRTADAVFIALHGAMGENGQLQATLDNFGIKYTGSGYIGSLLAMDKDLSKQILCRAGVNTPEWIYFDTDKDSPDRIAKEIGYPCVIKPCSCGSSVGVSIVDDERDALRAIAEAAKFEKMILVEKKIVGRELTAAILGDEVLPPIEILPRAGFYDYKNKYQAGMTEEICPAPLSDAVLRDLCAVTRRAFAALRLRGYARFDYILDGDNRLWCLEANTLPGMTPTSLLPQMAREAGISYADLCEKIVRFEK